MGHDTCCWVRNNGVIARKEEYRNALSILHLLSRGLAQVKFAITKTSKVSRFRCFTSFSSCHDFLFFYFALYPLSKPRIVSAEQHFSIHRFYVYTCILGFVTVPFKPAFRFCRNSMIWDWISLEFTRISHFQGSRSSTMGSRGHHGYCC